MILAFGGGNRDLKTTHSCEKVHLTTDLKGCVLFVVIDVLGVEILDPAEFGATDEPFFHLLQFIIGSLKKDFNLIFLEVSDPSVQPQGLGLVVGPATEIDALYLAADNTLQTSDHGVPPWL